MGAGLAPVAAPLAASAAAPGTDSVSSTAGVSSTASVSSTDSARAVGAEVPGFWTAAPGAGRGTARPGAETVAGTSRLVTLRTDLLPRTASGQRIGFDTGRAAPVTGRITRLQRGPGFTAWTGSLDTGVGDFSIVRAGSTYRASVYSPDGTWAVTRAHGDLYWVTHVAAYAGATGGARSDAVGGAAPRAQTRAAQTRAAQTRAAQTRPQQRAAADRRGKRGKVRVDIVFAYTPSAKDAAGGTKAGITAAVGQAAADTNTALANSGLRVELKVRGIVRTKGSERGGVFKTLNRIQRLRDGDYDSATKARAARRADLVHVFTGGASTDTFCGAGTVPYRPSTANPALGQSTSYVSCLPYLVATHEIGHNLGADHDVYPGVGLVSKVPYARGHVDVAHHFYTVMGYPNACFDAGVYDCARIPYFSSPTTTYAGVPLGGAEADNTKVIAQTAPRVARYR